MISIVMFLLGWCIVSSLHFMLINGIALLIGIIFNREISSGAVLLGLPYSLVGGFVVTFLTWIQISIEKRNVQTR